LVYNLEGEDTIVFVKTILVVPLILEYLRTLEGRITYIIPT